MVTWFPHMPFLRSWFRGKLERVISIEWQARVQTGEGDEEWGKGDEAGAGEEEGGQGEEGKEGKEVGEEEGVERESVVEEEDEGVGGADLIVLGGWDGAAADATAAGAGAAGASAGTAGGSDGEGGTNSGRTVLGASTTMSALRVFFSKAGYGMTRLQLIGRSEEGNEALVGPVHTKPNTAREVVTRFTSSLATASFFCPPPSFFILLYPPSSSSILLSPLLSPPLPSSCLLCPPIASSALLIRSSQQGCSLPTAPPSSRRWLVFKSSVHRPSSLASRSSHARPQLTAEAFIADSTAQLSLLVDRPLGAASLTDGQIEVMLHQ
ncbi:unnamed protein product [Closterium sp. NIES-65]|nr:unnamed protein product [Closterium sp. NIES-65]